MYAHYVVYPICSIPFHCSSAHLMNPQNIPKKDSIQCVYKLFVTFKKAFMSLQSTQAVFNMCCINIHNERRTYKLIHRLSKVQQIFLLMIDHINRCDIFLLLNIILPTCFLEANKMVLNGE